MTDEQFIRAIVDHPADDLPRMAYADWLEEQSDPRYVYLLVEKEAVRTGDISMLKDLAGGYDPVGVARVSRPPVGICCDHIQYADSGPIVTRTMIDTFEEESARRDLKYGGHPEPFFVGLPDGYRALMLNSNGGETNELTFSVPGVENIKPFTARVRLRFFRFGEKITIEDPTGPWGLWLSLATAIDIDDPTRQPDELLLRLDQENVGRVYYLSLSHWHDWEIGEFPEIAASLSAFFQLLTPLREQPALSL